jgi:hypothetical protein
MIAGIEQVDDHIVTIKKRTYLLGLERLLGTDAIQFSFKDKTESQLFCNTVRMSCGIEV